MPPGTLTFNCSSCNAELMVDDRLAGHQVDCTFCKMVVRAPGEIKDDPNALILNIPRCPKCQGRLQEVQEVCGFCGHYLGKRVPSRLSQIRGKETVLYNPSAARRKLILGSVLGGLIVVAGLLRVFSDDEGEDSTKRSPVERCLRHMILMHFAMQEYITAKSAPPEVTGSEFWSTILQRDGRTGMLQCPAGCGKKRPSHFRGPAKPFSELLDTGILGATHPDDHEGGLNVLLKNGTVLFVPATDPFYPKVLAATLE